MGGSGGFPLPLLVGRDHLAVAVAVASLSSGSLARFLSLSSSHVTPASFMEFWGWEMAGTIKWVSLRRPLGLQWISVIGPLGFNFPTIKI